jgi:hypothetical protein
VIRERAKNRRKNDIKGQNRANKIPPGYPRNKHENSGIFPHA